MRGPSRSSIRRTTFHPRFLARSQLTTNVRALPRWRAPVGEGARRVTFMATLHSRSGVSDCVINAARLYFVPNRDSGKVGKESLGSKGNYMARPATAAFNIAQLERILHDRRTDLNRLERQRSELQRKLDGVERQIGKLNGGLRGRPRGGGGGGRARNEHSLVEVIESVMRGGKPMRVGDIVDAVQAGGYR